MTRRDGPSDDNEYQEESKASSLPKNLRTPRTYRARRASNKAEAGEVEEQSRSEVSYTTPKRRRIEEAQEPGYSPSKAVLEAEAILAQYSPGTKREVKVSDLERLKATHEERRQGALMKVENQKRLIEERRNEIFARLAGLGYSGRLIERDQYDQLKARARWWQLVEEPQELTEEEWEKIRHDLCVILDRRKETVRSLREKGGGTASSSPSRPKLSPQRLDNINHPSLHQSAPNVRSPVASGKHGLKQEVDERQEDSEGSSGPLPKLVLKHTSCAGTEGKDGDGDG